MLRPPGTSGSTACFMASSSGAGWTGGPVCAPCTCASRHRCSQRQQHLGFETRLAIAQQQTAAMRLGHETAQVQAEPGTARVAAAGIVGSPERLAELVERRRRYA